MPEIVHHHGELVGPLAEPVPQQQVAALGRRVLLPVTQPRVLEVLGAGIDPDPAPSPGAGLEPARPAPARIAVSSLKHVAIRARQVLP